MFSSSFEFSLSTFFKSNASNKTEFRLLKSESELVSVEQVAVGVFSAGGLLFKLTMSRLLSRLRSNLDAMRRLLWFLSFHFWFRMF